MANISLSTECTREVEAGYQEEEPVPTPAPLERQMLRDSHLMSHLLLCFVFKDLFILYI